MLKLLKTSIFNDYLLFLKTFLPGGRRRDTPVAPLDRGFPLLPPLFFRVFEGAGSSTSVYNLTICI
jgi:hypothetical protein